MVKLSVIIPCYNEESRFPDGFRHYLSYLKRQKYSWELILVNDGSDDKTLELMLQQSKFNKNIKVVSYKLNRGKGFAIVQGVKRAEGQYILFTDIDHSVRIETIDKFFDFFEKGFEIVIGSRRVMGAKFVKKQHPMREFLGRGFTFLVKILIDWEIKDATCGFKAFKKEAAKVLFPKIKIYGWAFDAEILFLAKKNNLKLSQVPVVWADVQGTKVTIIKDIFKSLFSLLKIRLNSILGVY